MPDNEKRTFVEEVEVAGNRLVEYVRELIDDSQTRRVIIRTMEGKELMSLPLTFGVVAGGLITLTAPLLAAVGALAAFVTKVKLEVIREGDAAPNQPGPETDKDDSATPSA